MNTTSTTTTVARVLLVEDDEDIRLALSRYLEERGYEVLEAVDGSQALERLHDPPPPDLILLDLHMPVLDGEGFCQLRRDDPYLSRIPVLVLSAYERVDPQWLADFKVDGYIAKPIPFNRLAGMLARYRRDERTALASPRALDEALAHHLRSPLARLTTFLDLLDERFAARLEGDERVRMAHMRGEAQRALVRLGELHQAFRGAMAAVEQARGAATTDLDLWRRRVFEALQPTREGLDRLLADLDAALRGRLGPAADEFLDALRRANQQLAGGLAEALRTEGQSPTPMSDQ